MIALALMNVSALNFLICNRFYKCLCTSLAWWWSTSWASKSNFEKSVGIFFFHPAHGFHQGSIGRVAQRGHIEKSFVGAVGQQILIKVYEFAWFWPTTPLWKTFLDEHDHRHSRKLYCKNKNLSRGFLASCNLMYSGAGHRLGYFNHLKLPTF